MSYYPEWLHSLQSVIPLDLKTIKFIQFTVSEIEKKYPSRRSSASDAYASEIRGAAGLIQKNFKLLVEELKKNSNIRQRFQERYPIWRRSRRDNVISLGDIANQMDAEKKDSLESKTALGVMSIIGGGAALLFGGLVPRLLIGAAIGLATIGDVAVTVEKGASLEENLKRAQVIVEKDQRAFEELLKLLNSVSALKEVVHAIKSVSVNGALRAAVAKFENLLPSVSDHNLSSQKMEIRISEIIKSLPFPPALRKDIADVVGILLTVSLLLARYENLFTMSFKRYRDMFKQRITADIICKVAAGVSSVKSILMKKIARGMAVDFLNVLLVSMQNPDSLEAQELRKIAVELNNEAQEFDKLYEEIKDLGASKYSGNFQNRISNVF